MKKAYEKIVLVLYLIIDAHSLHNPLLPEVQFGCKYQQLITVLYSSTRSTVRYE
jgi:hypothetical protein